ncbi:hypothetical protein [Henriciella litoralis]|uniref:hypothetical protein n=1 Tax=Henriciella litoralis TaxID=568102 RepID=UPI000A03E57B|nr:hypothetical protein [Henriciella litoralis]
MLPKFVKGQETGIEFPTTIESLLEAGPDFLTKAFRAAGSLPEDDRVTEITRAKEFVGGGMGRKLLLDVAYERGDGLHRNLFIKFPHDYGHPLRELFCYPMEAEVRLYLLSIKTALPIEIPAGYFADFDHETVSGIVITERVAFEEGGIGPMLEKCQDFNLDDPLAYYKTVVKSVATLAGAHRAGKLGAGVGEKFPMPATQIEGGEVFRHSREVMDEKLAKIREYAAAAPQLLPKNFASKEFLDRFCNEVSLVLDHHKEIYAYINSQDDLVALCHWNINIDNAWFWRDAAGELQVGLLDWGNVCQMNLARAFWGMICAAELDMIDAHRRELMEDFVHYYHAGGGPKVSVDDFELSYRLTISVEGLLWMCDAPTIVEANLPNYAEMSGRHDPRLQNTFLARAQQHILTVMLNEFSFSNVSEIIPDVLSENAQLVAQTN